jgi:hypothetical protein
LKFKGGNIFMYFILKNANFSNSNIGKITVQEGTVGGGGSSSGGGSPVTYTFTISPTPSSATVKLTATGYTQSGNSITVPGGTTVNYTVSASGYNTVSSSKQVWSTQTLPVTLNSSSGSGGNPNPPSGGGGNGVTWYINSLDAVAATGKDITGGTVFTGSSIAPVAFDNTFNAKLVGKTIDTVEFVPEKAGEITFGVYNTTTYAYTEKASITIA